MSPSVRNPTPSRPISLANAKSRNKNPEFELDELAAIYVERGVDQRLARQVAQQLMAKDALGAHARDELGMSEITTARPVQAALTSAAMFSTGAAMPLLMAAISPANVLIPIVSAASLAFSLFSEQSGQEPVVETFFAPQSGLHFGRLGVGYHGRYRKSLRHNRLKDGTARAAIKTTMEVNFLIPRSCGPRRSVSVPFPAPTGSSSPHRRRPDRPRLGSGRDAPRQSSHRRCAMPR